jgi:hypothetical protein
MDAQSADLQRRLEALLNKRSVAWRGIEHGYTPALRWIVTFDDGSSCFVKAGDDIIRPGAAHTTAEGLRREYAVYSQLKASFMPSLLAWDDGAGATLLVLEDLSDAFWPPPWSEGRVRTVLKTLDDVHATRLSSARFVRENVQEDVEPAGWMQIAADPGPFLSLGLASANWLDRALPELLAACERGAGTEGDDLCHWDVRSDNLCLRGDQAILIDWNWAAVGNGRLDTAFWLPSLQVEGGPLPEAILPDSPDLAAIVSGFFAARAGLPVLPALPRVRASQLDQLRSALPWAVRTLSLPPLDGPVALSGRSGASPIR